MIKSWWNFWNTVGRLISCLMRCRNLPDTIFLQPWHFWITYIRTSKLSCLSRLLPVLFKRIRCTNTWCIPLYKLFLNAVRPHLTWSWIWVILPLFLWIAVFHRLRILIILLNSVFPELKGAWLLYFLKRSPIQAYRQFLIDPKDSHVLGFNFDNQFCFDTRRPFGLRTWVMICQRIRNDEGRHSHFHAVRFFCGRLFRRFLRCRNSSVGWNSVCRFAVSFWFLRLGLFSRERFPIRY